MARYSFPAFNNASTPRYVVVWDIYWHVMACQRLEPGSDLYGGFLTTLDHLRAAGWEAEGEPKYGFVFIRRAGERRLLMLTPRDPCETTRQSFDPFRGK